MHLEKKTIESFGLISAKSYYFKPENVEQVYECISFAKKNGLKICALGGCMSFSDVCLIEDNISLDIKALIKIEKFDIENGIVVAQAGVLTRNLISLVMPHGWHICSLSGSLGNTLGGDISNNVNGKDSWQYGNFGTNIESMKILLSNGNIVEANNENNKDLFYASIGGMGLMGIIIEVTLRLKKIPSYMVEIKTQKYPNINSLIYSANLINNSDATFFYIWSDLFPNNASFGRGTIETAKFIECDIESNKNIFLNGLIEKQKIGKLPPYIFWNLVKLIEFQLSYKVFNSLKYHLAKKNNTNVNTVSFPDYQYPMIKHFPQWNIKFKPKGFHEFQPIFPENNFEEAINEIKYVCRKHNYISQLCSIRKHIKEPYYFSFSDNGFSLSLIHPLNKFSTNEIKKFNSDLIKIVIKYNGKVNLGKFPYLTQHECKSMYPDYNLFINAKNKFDEINLFSSNASKRLGLSK